MAKFNIKEMHIFGMGNPLLDITATVDDAFLEKYGLPKNSAILAEAKHEPMYEEVINKYEIEYSAGGATQNTMRYCQWVVGKNLQLTTFIGAVGNDYFGKIMEQKAKDDGVNVHYQKVDDALTGTCAVLLNNNGKYRSLCAYLGACKKFDKHFLLSNSVFIEKAKLYYISGHMLPVSHESVLHIAQHSMDWGKDFFFNLAAPYVTQKCQKELEKLMPYVDFFFANLDEARAFATMKGYKTKDSKEIAKLIAKEPKQKYNNPRIPSQYKAGRVVVITQSENPVILFKSDWSDCKEFPVPQLSEKELKDTNGAGDAFTGGFLAMYIWGKPLEQCIDCAIYCATECVKQQGCTLPKTMSYKF
ncbi:uncharacterized protein LOC113793733 [Dermatophagoides pteronyssinus]|uniref:Adenosine kinase n=1 Tax=Dermatophagoides pteronyssinus TaxID=6956 RepID=A0A6P6Y578_DERPT|nr:adenosine kinase-like [Dermatophagoides pteronyssinus]